MPSENRHAPTRPACLVPRHVLPATLPLAAALAVLVIARPAQAVPSYAEQTGQPCQACHVGGFGPQLTPFGREFKLGGYTLRTKPFNVPLAAMAIASYTHTNKDQVPAPDHIKANDNIAFDQGSVFLAGGVGQHFGGFVQVTYDGVGRAWAWDNVDLRAVTQGKVFGKDAVFGLTFNNSPTTQDVWNTTPAWGFPYTDTAVSSTPGAAALIDGGLAQNTLGVAAYSWIDHKLYLEGGAYTSPKAGTLRWLGADPADPGDIHGLAPYGRVAYQTDIGGGTLEVGAFALKAAINPGRDRSTGRTDHYTDAGLDLSWLKPDANGDTFTADLRYVHENADLRATCLLALAPANCAGVTLNEWRGTLGYNWRGKVGTTVSLFASGGRPNGFLYGGSGRPNSNGVMAQVDYTPWGAGNSPLGPRAALRMGAQFTAYGRFDGARRNYDGAGANAADNNALRLFTWIAF
ncbi:hypothetical protein AQZ52_01715 [Novosphingobium fuchskuhlense]|uniref:Cytochrome C n=1 Tax=Novosphingobium fuchskuhlense TaxID=1117702 RepID=A0A117UZG8_9SPHN|nr:hypothetical protein [Novosphingobium fuchskuhlense]KUR73711.1 hypothetical protein AQZ52_01715 [Novosphingobium fuchskuhlense]